MVFNRGAVALESTNRGNPMSDTPQTPPPSSESNPQPSPRKKKRWWLRVLLGVVVIVILLIVLAPTIASMGFVRSIVLGKVNDNLNGKVSLDDLSLGWFSGAKIQGVTVTDPQGRKVVTLDKVTTGLTVLDVVRGNFALGDVVIDGLHFDLVIDANGRSNLENVSKPGPEQPKKTTAPGKLPNVSGNITLTNSSGTIQKAGLPETVAVDLKGNVKIPDINSPIDNSLDVGLKVGSQPAGSVSLAGKIAAIKNNQVLQDLHQIVIDETLKLQGIDLPALRPFVPPTIDTLQGRIDGQLAAKLGKGGVIVGKIVTSNLLVRGPILNGDTYKTSTLVFSLPHVLVASDNGAIIAGQGQDTDPIHITFDQGDASLRIAAPLKTLQNLAAMAAPGDRGMLRADLKVDLAMLAAQLPHTLHVLPDVKIQSADLVAFEDIQMTPTQAVVKQHIELPNGIKGQNTKTNAPVQVSPIVFDSNVTDLGKTTTQSIPDIRDLRLALTSSFASADFQGQSLGAINGKASGDLAKMKSELGQVINFGDTQMQGTFDATVETKGDLTNNTAPVDLNAAVTLHNLQIASAGKPAINQPWMNATVAGKLQHNQTDVNAIDNVQATVRTGNEQSPTIDLLALADIDLAKNTTNFELQKLIVDLAKAQSEFAAMLGQGNGTIRSGTLSATAKGTYDGQTAHVASFHAAPTNITIDRNGATILQGYGATLDITDAALDLKSKSATINQFTMDDGNRMLTVHSAQGIPIAVKMPAKGLPFATMKLDLTAQLAPLMELASAFKPASTQPSTELHWTGGTITSQIALATDDKTNTIQLNLPSLAGKDIAFQRGNSSYKTEFTAAAAASVTPQGSSIQDVNVSQLDLKSPLATVGLSKPIVIQNLQNAANTSANGGIHVTGDLAAVKQLLDAMQGTAPAQGGSVAGNLDYTATFATQGSAISLNGNGKIANLSAKAADSNTPFTEASVTIVNDLTLDNAKDSVTLKNVAVAMESSKSLNVTLTGAIDSLKTARNFQNVQVALNYDAAKLLQLARPFLSPEMQTRSATWNVTGSEQRQIVITGSYPADLPPKEALKKIHIVGGVGVGSVVAEGFTVQQLGQPFELADGQFKFTTPSKSPTTQPNAAAVVNSGALILDGLVVNLATDQPQLNTKDQTLLQNIQLNPIIAKNCLKFAPLFADATEAAGRLTVDHLNANNLAITDLSSDKSGHLDLHLDLSDAQILNNLLSQLAQYMGGGNEKGFTGHVYSKQLTIDNGVVNQDIMFELGQYNIEFVGGVGLKNLDLRDFTIIIPSQMLAKIEPRLASLKGGIPITLTGSANSPRLDIGKSVAAFVEKNFKDNPLGTIEGLLNKGGSNSGAQSQQQPSNSSGGLPGELENLLGGGHKSNSAQPAPSKQKQQQQPQSTPQKSQPNKKAPATKPTTKPSPLRDLRKLLQ